jgi:hypothetical protein
MVRSLVDKGFLEIGKASAEGAFSGLVNFWLTFNFSFVL